jgi:organic hydroperoxide reductase OsmC/OhrA
MSETFSTRTTWARGAVDFTYDTYSRSHELEMGSGLTVPMSAAPGFLGDATRVNPEELLVGALSSCHMLTFLAIAAKKRFVVDAYDDNASGVLDKGDDGRLAVTAVVLRPKVRFAGDRQPTADELSALHASAHRGCFIANSVKTEVSIEAA